MNRPLLPSPSFTQTLKRFAKKNPQISGRILKTLRQLAEDAFHPSLKVHKLSGKLEGYWACSAGYDLRIIFEFLQQDTEECILLLSIGTHDKVY
jgi:addiction module RelE/StbE family toxin